MASDLDYFLKNDMPESAPTKDVGGLDYFTRAEVPASADNTQLSGLDYFLNESPAPAGGDDGLSYFTKNNDIPTPSPRPSVPSVLLPPAGKDPKRGVREPSPQLQAPQASQQTIQGLGEAFGQFKERMDIGAKDWEINDAISTAINQDDINSLTELQGRRQAMQERTARLAQPDNFWEKAITGVAQILPQQWTGSLKPRLKGAVTGAVGAGVAGTALPIPEEILTVPGGAAWGFKWLGGAESARLWWKQSMAEIYMDMRDDGLSHDEAKLASQIGAVPYAGIELLQFTQFLPKNMRGTPVEVLWREAIKDGTTAILKRGGIEYLKNVAKESGEEGVQEAIKDVTSNIAKSFQNRARDAGYETKGMGEILQRGISATIEAVPAMTLLGLGGSVTDTGVALNRRAKTTNKQQQMDSWRDAGAKIIDVDKDSFVAELENGKSVGVQFVKDFVDQAKDDPQGFMNSIKTSKAGRKAVDKALKKAENDIEAVDRLIKDGWLPQGDTVGATTLTDEQGNTISVDQLIQLEEGYATEGVAQHELWHAAKQLAGVTAEEQAQLDEALDTADITDPQLKEEAEAYAFENYADQNRVLKKVADFIRFVKSGFKQQGEDTQATVENLRDEVVKRLMQEKPAVSEEQKYETLTPERRQAIDSLPDFTRLTPELEQVRGLEPPQFAEAEDDLDTLIPEPPPVQVQPQVQEGVDAETGLLEEQVPEDAIQPRPEIELTNEILEGDEVFDPIEPAQAQEQVKAEDIDLKTAEQLLPADESGEFYRVSENLPDGVEAGDGGEASIYFKKDGKIYGYSRNFMGNVELIVSEGKLPSEIRAEGWTDEKIVDALVEDGMARTEAWNVVREAGASALNIIEKKAVKKETKKKSAKPTAEQTERKQLQARARELGVKDTGGNKAIRERIAKKEAETAKLEKQIKKDSQALVRAVTGKDAKTAEPKAETLDDVEAQPLPDVKVQRGDRVRIGGKAYEIVKLLPQSELEKKIGEQAIEVKKVGHKATAKETVDISDIDTKAPALSQYDRRGLLKLAEERGVFVKKGWSADEIRNQLREKDKRKKAGAKFSVSQEQDAEYLKAVEAGDTAKAQRMVDEAVWNNYGSHIKDVYHGSKTKGFKEFDIPSKGFNSNFLGSWEVERNGAFFSDDKATAKEFSEQAGVTGGEVRRFNLLGDYANFESIDEGLFNALVEKGVNERWLYNTQKTWELFDKENDPDGVLPKALKALDYDGAWFEEEGGKTYVVLEPQNIKLADPVTYDDQGNVIPLSERFTESPDIRFSVSQPAGEVAKTEPATAVNQHTTTGSKLLATLLKPFKKAEMDEQNMRKLNAFEEWLAQWIDMGRAFYANKNLYAQGKSTEYAINSRATRAKGEVIEKLKEVMGVNKYNLLPQITTLDDADVSFAMEEGTDRIKLTDRQKKMYDALVELRDKATELQTKKVEGQQSVLEQDWLSGRRARLEAEKEDVLHRQRGRKELKEDIEAIEALQKMALQQEDATDSKKVIEEIRTLTRSVERMRKRIGAGDKKLQSQLDETNKRLERLKNFDGYVTHVDVWKAVMEIKHSESKNLEERLRLVNDLQLFHKQRDGLVTLREYTEGWTDENGKKHDPILTKEDLMPDKLVMQMLSDAYGRVATMELINYGTAEGLIVTDPASGKNQYNSEAIKRSNELRAQGWKPMSKVRGLSSMGFKYKLIHPVMQSTIESLTETKQLKTGFDKVLAMTKVGQFVVPGIIWTYNELQRLMGGVWTFNPIRATETTRRAWKEFLTTGELYREAEKNGAFQTPGMATEATVQEELEIASKSLRADIPQIVKALGGITNIPIKNKGARQILQDIIDEARTNPKALGTRLGNTVMVPYRTIGNATWAGDNVQRMYTYMLAKDVYGMTPEKAGQYTADIHGAYGALSAKYRRYFSRIFFVHSFRVLMPMRIWSNMTTLPKMMMDNLIDKEKAKNYKPADYRLATQAFVGTMGLPIVTTMLMTANGWEPDDEGLPQWWKDTKTKYPLLVPFPTLMNNWKFKKNIVTPDGKKREVVVGLNNIVNMPTKWIERTTKDRPERLDDLTYHLINVFKWEINPMYRLIYDVVVNESSIGQTNPVDRKAPVSEQIWQATAYIAGNSLRLYHTMLQGDVDTAQKRQVREQLDGALNGLEKVLLGYYSGYGKGADVRRFAPASFGYTYTRPERRARLGSAQQSLARAVSAEKGYIKRTFKDKPDEMRKMIRELNILHRKRKRRLREIFLGD